MKKSILVFVAVLTVLVMVSSAVGMQLKSGKNVSCENDKAVDVPFVDPRVKISSSYLPWLKQGVENVKDEENEVFLSRVIDEVKSRGVLDSEDVKDILVDLGITDSEIYSGFVSVKTETKWVESVGGPPEEGIFGYAHTFPGFFLSTFMFYVGPSILASWDTGEEEIESARVGLFHEINRPHSGLAVGNIFTYCSNNHYYWDWVWGHHFSIFSPYSLFIKIDYK